MEQDLDLDLNDQEERLKEKNRFEKLSEKVIFTAKERDDALAKIKQEEEARAKLEKERDFFRDFSKISVAYPAASAYQDKILEKVNAGYSAEDAALAILAKEGKLQAPPSPPTPPPDNVAGGSAATIIADQEKSPEEMSKEEKRSALLELEKQGTNLLKF